MKKCVLTIVLALTTAAWATTYIELVPWLTVKGSSTGTNHQAAAVQGQVSYHQLSTAANITRVAPLNGVQTTTVLLDSNAWFNAAQTSSMTTWYGFSVAGDYVQFTETSSDQVWRVNKNTGAITAYATKADIMAVTGLTSVRLLSPSDTNAAGETVFYEGNAKALLVTAGPNNVQMLASSAQLQAATGNDTVSGGLAWDAYGNVYWGSNTSDDMWRRNADGSIVQVLTNAQIAAVTGSTTVVWKDVLAAPDGWIYFGDNTSKAILRFNPANPSGTLSIFLSEADLLAGPMASNNPVCLGWYDPDGAGPNPGGLTFHTFSTKGLYYVPEPAGLMLALLGLTALRRR